MLIRRKILVADDSQMIREMLRLMLSKAGYEVIFAEDGESVVAMAASEKPDLVISDGLLPKLHGFLACKAIKEFENPPKVVLLTGVYTKPTYRWEVKKEYGADDLLLKPVTAVELLACLEKHLAELPLREESIAFADLSAAIELTAPAEKGNFELMPAPRFNAGVYGPTAAS
jgi:DNA-binding response OmpR family regulator